MTKRKKNEDFYSAAGIIGTSDPSRGTSWSPQGVVGMPTTHCWCTDQWRGGGEGSGRGLGGGIVGAYRGKITPSSAVRTTTPQRTGGSSYF